MTAQGQQEARVRGHHFDPKLLLRQSSLRWGRLRRAPLDEVRKATKRQGHGGDSAAM